MMDESAMNESAAKSPHAPFSGHLRIALAATMILSGCAVGPDFLRPRPPTVETYTPSQESDLGSPGADETPQRLQVGAAVTTDWWTLFHAPSLDRVVQQAIADNRTLAAAKFTLAQAQQAVIQARGGLYPQIDLEASAERQRTSASRANQSTSSRSSGGSQTFNLFSVGPTVSYDLDAFGGTTRRIEQQEALAENQRYQLAAAYLTLTGNSVAQAISIASLRMQIAAVEEIIADDEKNLDLVRQQVTAGKAAEIDILAADSQLANDRTQLPPLRQQLSAARHALSILVGQFPSQWQAPDFDLKDFTLPADLPLTVPSELVRQRPDILAAEATLHADSAAIGIATAQMYPSITLSGAVGTQSSTTARLFESSSLFWNIAAGLTAPVFHGGALEAQKQGAIDAFQASAATYQQTVLQAFGQVADTLRALGNDADLINSQRGAVDASAASLRLQRLSYAAGKTNLLQLLDAERTYEQVRLGYAKAEAQRYQDTAQLFLAMGGGWWNAQSDGLGSNPRNDALDPAK